MTINVAQLIGENAVSIQKGEILYNEISRFWDSSELIELDFNNVKVFATPFFNRGVAPFLKDIKIEELQKKLSFKNMNDIGRSVLNHVIHNAIEYYSDEKLKEGIDKNIKG